ncbi:MAG: hypothetical protein FAF03_04155 [Epsilonproteobacteria bacterium]|nr:hypothetical protein [Campylobacterota bacterium]
MKKIVTTVVIVSLSSCLYGKNKDLNIASNIKNSIEKKIKMKNIRNTKVFTQEIYVLKTKNTSDKILAKTLNKDIVYYAYPNGNKFNSRSDIMVKFNQHDVNIEEIEYKYDLKLIRKMNSGDFLFKNLDGNTLEKINLILQDETLKVKRILPNMKLNMKTY